MLTLEIMKPFASLRFGWIAIALAAACGGTPNEDPEASEIVLQPDARAGGVSPVLGGCAMFPADNPWNQPIDDLPVHPSSEAFIASIGADGFLHADFGVEQEGGPQGIPYSLVSAAQPAVNIEFTAYGYQSDPGPYPIPPSAKIEGGPNSAGDRHVLVLETTHCVLYELYRAFPVVGGASWQADSGAVFDLKTNAERPLGWTSADAAGLPILPGLVRYDEVVEKKRIAHALRFTVERSQAGFIAPARHYASDDPDPRLPPMGLRLRLKGDHDCSPLSSEAQVICDALKRYGMLVADNGTSWYISGAPDPRWDEAALADLERIPASALEVVETGPVTRLK